MAFFEVWRFAAIQQVTVDTGSNVGTQVALPLVHFGQNSPARIAFALDPPPHHSSGSVEVIEGPFARAGGRRGGGIHPSLPPPPGLDDSFPGCLPLLPSQWLGIEQVGIVPLL